MRSIDIRSEAAVKLIAEFLDLDEPHSQDGRPVNAEHFAHGMSVLEDSTRLLMSPRSVLLCPFTL